MERSFFGLMLAYCGIAALTWVGRPRWRRPGSRLLVVCLALAADRTWARFRSASWRARYFPRAVEKYAGDGSRIIASREGRTETILPDGTVVDGPPRLPTPGDRRFLDVRHAPDRQALHAAVRLLADAAARGAAQERAGDLLRRRHDRAGGHRARFGRVHRRGGDLERRDRHERHHLPRRRQSRCTTHGCDCTSKTAASSSASAIASTT